MKELCLVTCIEFLRVSANVDGDDIIDRGIFHMFVTHVCSTVWVCSLLMENPSWVNM